MLITGEGGIGKTRLAEELCDRAGQRGARCVWGHCSDEAAVVAYWPWVQVLRASRKLHPAPPAPPTSALLNTAGHPPGAAPDRFALFDECAEQLAAAATTSPLVVVLDDLHASDLSSVALLRFLQQNCTGSRC